MTDVIPSSSMTTLDILCPQTEKGFSSILPRLEEASPPPKVGGFLFEFKVLHGDKTNV